MSVDDSVWTISSFCRISAHGYSQNVTFLRGMMWNTQPETFSITPILSLLHQHSPIGLTFSTQKSFFTDRDSWLETRPHCEHIHMPVHTHANTTRPGAGTHVFSSLSARKRFTLKWPGCNCDWKYCNHRMCVCVCVGAGAGSMCLLLRIQTQLASLTYSFHTLPASYRWALSFTNRHKVSVSSLRVLWLRCAASQFSQMFSAGLDSTETRAAWVHFRSDLKSVHPPRQEIDGCFCRDRKQQTTKLKCTWAEVFTSLLSNDF